MCIDRLYKPLVFCLFVWFISLLALKVRNCEHENEEKQFFMDMVVYFNHRLNL